MERSNRHRTVSHVNRDHRAIQLAPRELRKITTFGVGFDFASFGWPWWGEWWYPPYDGYYPYYDDYYPYDDDPPAYGSQYDTEYWNNLAMSVQTKLADQGYYRGQIDGIIGSGSVQAIRQFQSDHRLAVNGKIDPKLLKALGIDYKT